MSVDDLRNLAILSQDSRQLLIERLWKFLPAAGVVQVLEVIGSLCPVCFDAERGCHCGRDE